MLLNKKFNVARGWPNGGAIDESFPIYSPGGVPVVLPSGTVIAVRSDGFADKATTPNRSTTNAVSPWVVVEGNDDYSGQYTNKCVALRGNAVLTLDPANFTAGALPVGTKLTFQTGVFRAAVTNDQIIGEVIADKQAIDGTIDMFFSGGSERML